MTAFPVKMWVSGGVTLYASRLVRHFEHVTREMSVVICTSSWNLPHAVTYFAQSGLGLTMCVFLRTGGVTAAYSE